MPSYAAVIGHQPHISLAELAATAPNFRLQRVIGNVALFESDGELTQRFLDRLGGTIVLAKAIENATDSLEKVPDVLLAAVSATKGKVTFSLRAYGVAPRALAQLYRKGKDTLKASGRSSRYVGNEHTAAPSIVLHENGLIDRSGGCELLLVQERLQEGKNRLWVGITTGAQDIDSYTMRDTEKPVRDTRVGLLPPKLAQVMLNFGAWLTPPPAPAEVDTPKTKGKGKEKKAPPPPPAMPYTVLDPFCGTGVIPMEALLRGYAVLASDKSEKAVTGCQKNLDWLRRKRDIKKSELPSAVWRQDATKPFDFQKVRIPANPNVIVTETSLGPPLKERPTIKDAQSHRSENEKLQEGFLKAVAQSLPGVPVVCTLPVWYCTKGPVWLERIWKVVEKLGYEPVLPPGIASATGRPSLLYRRPDQVVGREIVLLKPTRT